MSSFGICDRSGHGSRSGADSGEEARLSMLISAEARLDHPGDAYSARWLQLFHFHSTHIVAGLRIHGLNWNGHRDIAGFLEFQGEREAIASLERVFQSD